MPVNRDTRLRRGSKYGLPLIGTMISLPLSRSVLMKFAMRLSPDAICSGVSFTTGKQVLLQYLHAEMIYVLYYVLSRSAGDILTVRTENHVLETLHFKRVIPIVSKNHTFSYFTHFER
jgi:hypothetical protein